jgi:hypothetical protein
LTTPLIADGAFDEYGTSVEELDENDFQAERGWVQSVNANDKMDVMQAALRSLISLGKSQGYLIRADVIAMLPTELDEDQLKDLAGMIGDMGILVSNEQPTASELAAHKAPPVSVATTPPVVHTPAATPIADPFVVLKIGAEGGAIRLIAQELTIGWRYRYRYSILDQTSLWLDEGDAKIRRQSAWVYDWSDALAALDRYPWAALRPLEVNTQFAGRVLEAVRERLVKQNSSIRHQPCGLKQNSSIRHQPCGLRVTEAREIYLLRERLKRYPQAVSAILQAARNMNQPVETLEAKDIRRLD